MTILNEVDVARNATKTAFADRSRSRMLCVVK